MEQLSAASTEEQGGGTDSSKKRKRGDDDNDDNDNNKPSAVSPGPPKEKKPKTQKTTIPSAEDEEAERQEKTHQIDAFKANSAAVAATATATVAAFGAAAAATATAAVAAFGAAAAAAATVVGGVDVGDVVKHASLGVCVVVGVNPAKNGWISVRTRQGEGMGDAPKEEGGKRDTVKVVRSSTCRLVEKAARARDGAEVGLRTEAEPRIFGMKTPDGTEKEVRRGGESERVRERVRM